MNRTELNNVCEFLRYIAEKHRRNYMYYRDKMKSTINPIKRYRYYRDAETCASWAAATDMTVFHLIREWEHDKQIFEKRKEEKDS